MCKLYMSSVQVLCLVVNGVISKILLWLSLATKDKKIIKFESSKVNGEWIRLSTFSSFFEGILIKGVTSAGNAL